MFHRNLTGSDLHEPTNVLIENATGGTLTALKVVKLTAFGTTRPTATAITNATEQRFGIVLADIANTELGSVTALGFMYNINTNAWPANTILYSDNSGNLTTSINGSPVAQVVKQHATTGILYVTTIAPGAGGSGASADTQINFAFSTLTAAANPGVATFRYNNATVASVTAIYINDSANSGVDVSSILSTLTTGNQLYIQQADTPGNYTLFTLTGSPTDNTGWWTIPVSVTNTGTLPANAADCVALVFYSGSITADEKVRVSSNDTTAKYLEDAIVSANSILTVDTLNDGADEDVRLTVNQVNINHDALNNFVANKHIDHTSVNINTAANSGLAGGGNISASRSLILDVNNLTADTPVAADSIPFYDVSGSDTNKTTITNLVSVINPLVSVADIQVSTQKLGATPYDDLRDYINLQSSTGSVTGGTITDGGLGTVDISAGSVYIRSTNSDLGQLFAADFSAVTGQALTDLVNNYIYIQYNVGVPNIVVSTSILSDNNTNVILGIVYRSGTEVHITNVSAKTQQVATRVGKRLALVEGLTRQSGSITSGVGTRNILISVGQWWLGLTEYTLSVVNTSVSDTFSYFYRDGGSGFLEVTAQTQISNTQYDDGSGTLATLGNSKYGVHWVYRGVDNDTYVIYGRASYSLTEAESAAQPDTLPGQMNGFHTALVAKIIIQKSAGAFTSVQNPYSSVFTQSTPTAHADLSGLGWTTSGHTGAINTLAGFDGTALPIGYTLSGTGTQVALTNSPTFVTPALGTPSSGNLSNTTNYPSSNIDHDATTNFVANEHIDHSAVNINTAANSGLTGGGDLTASRSLSLDINNLVADTIVGADSIPFYDVSGADNNKTTVANFITAINSSIDHGGLTGLGDDDHTIYTKADGTRAFTGNQSLGGNKITSLADGVAASDAINKGQLDAAMNGLKPKAAVRFATTAPITIATALNSGDSLDGGTLANGDRVLVKDNSLPEENGIWIVDPVPYRAPDFDSISPIDEINGAMVPVEEGTVNAGKIFVQSGAPVVTIGTDPINFVYFNSISNLVGAEGITISGVNISIDHDGEGLIFSGAGVSAQLALELDGSTLSKSGAGLKLTNTAVTPNPYGSASNVPTFTVDAQGRLTAAADVAIAIAASAVTSGTFADARISQSSVTQHVGAIDHNLLLNYSANNHVPSMTAGSVVFHDGTILSQNNAKFFWNNTDNRLFLGQDANTNIYVLNTSTSGQTVLSAEDASVNLFGQVIGRSGTASNQGGQVTFYRSRGTTAAKTVVATNDNLGRILFTGFDGTDFARAARIDAVVTEVTPGPLAMGTKLVFSTTPAGTEGVVTAMEISSAQVVNFVNTPTGFNVEALSTALTAGSVVFSNGTNLTQDNTNFFFDNTNDQLAVGHNVTGSIAVGGINPTPRYIAYNENILDQGFATISSENTNPATYNGFGIYRSRGTVGSPTSVSSGDVIGAMSWFGRDATDYQSVGSIIVSTIGTIGAGSIPSTMSISTSNGAAIVNAIAINQNQLTSVLKGLSVTGNTADISPTAAITNNPYTFLVDGPGTNLIPNPSFANNITDSWVATGTSTNTRDTSEKWIGDASLKVVSSADNSGLKSSAITVTPNTQYVFSAYIKGAVGGESVNLRIDPNVSANVDSNNQGGFNFVTILTAVNTDWSRITLAWTSGASDTSVELFVMSDTATAQTFYADGIQFEQKTWPTNSTETVFASSFISGDMGVGYSWAGTPNNSASSRTAGAKFLAPTIGNRGNFVLRSDGTVARFLADAKEVQTADLVGARNEPNFPFTFIGNMKTNVVTSGISAGIMNVRNTADGTAFQVESAVATADGMVLSFPSITSGSGMTVFGPSDLTAMQAAGGKFFQFAGKGQNQEIYQWKVDVIQMGALAFTFNKNVNIYGGGSQLATTRVIAGQVLATTGSAVVTKAGGAFLTEFKRGQAIRIANDGAATAFTNYTIASVDSDTQITMTSAYTPTLAAASARDYDGLNIQYAPPVIHLEGSYGHHGAAGNTAGDYMYGLFASGGNGALRVIKSAARGVAVTPTADNQGSGIAMSRQVVNSTVNITASAAETTVITGYTSPAYELIDKTVFRIKFCLDITALASTTTVTWKVKIGGTTILTSNAQQVGSTATITATGEIDIVGTGTNSQRTSVNIVGKDTSVTPSDTYELCEYAASSIDMRVDRAITVTAQFSDASTMAVYYHTMEIL